MEPCKESKKPAIDPLQLAGETNQQTTELLLAQDTLFANLKARTQKIKEKRTAREESYRTSPPGDYPQRLLK